MPAEGGSPKKYTLTFNIAEAAWGPEGKAVYLTEDSRNQDLLRYWLASGKVEKLTEFSDDYKLIGRISTSPDGKRVAVTRIRQDADAILIRNFRPINAITSPKENHASNVSICLPCSCYHLQCAIGSPERSVCTRGDHQTG
jgi:hypothetical protein